MDPAVADDLPEFREMGIAAVRLLQGVLYAEEVSAWDALLANEVELANYFAKIGLVVVVDRGEGLAYLRQLAEDERTGGYEKLPRLFRRTPLGYDATLLCVLLRDEYRRFEDEDVDNNNNHNNNTDGDPHRNEDGFDLSDYADEDGQYDGSDDG